MSLPAEAIDRARRSDIIDNAREAILCEDYFAATDVMKDVERASAETRAILRREAGNG